MFMRIIFMKLKIKPKKYFMALAYSIFYFVLFFIISLFSSIYLSGLNITKTFSFSLLVGCSMFVVYLIKEELFFKSKTL